MSAHEVETWFNTIPADVQRQLLAVDPLDDREPHIYVIPTDLIDALPAQHLKGQWFVQVRAGMAGGPIETEAWYAVAGLAKLLTKRRNS